MRKRLFGVYLAFLQGFLVGFSHDNTIAADARYSLQAGAFAQDITPTKWPVSVNGNMVDRQATAAHDPLHARCIVLKNQETSLAIVVCDSFALPRELVDRAKLKASTNTGIPVSHILISATHSHSCPTLTAIFQSEPDNDYAEFLIEQIAQGIGRANDQIEPAKVGWGSVKDRSLLFNRRWIVKNDVQPGDETTRPTTVKNPFGTSADRILSSPGFSNPVVTLSINQVDSEIGFLTIQARDGRPIALLANYSLQYIGGVPEDVVSADYFGEFAQRIATKLHAGDVQPPFVGIMSNGTSGDVTNVDYRQPKSVDRPPFEQIEYAAEVLAQDIFRAHDLVEYHDEVPLKAIETEIVVGVRRPTAAEATAAERRLATVTETPLRDLELIYARETMMLAKYETSQRVKLQAMRIGSLGIGSSPCETFAETGLAIKKGSPFKVTFTISLANGYNGYLPPPEQMLLGGFETWRSRLSYLSSDAEPKIQSTLKRLLKEVGR